MYLASDKTTVVLSNANEASHDSIMEMEIVGLNEPMRLFMPLV